MTEDNAVRGMLALCTAILVAAALYLARSIFTPVAFALFAMAIVWPFQRALQARMPKLVALLCTLVLTLIVLGALALAIAWGTSQIGQWLLSNLDRFQFIYTKMNEWLEGHGIFASALLAERFDVSWLVGFAQQVAARLNGMSGFALLIFAFTILGLMEVGEVGTRMAKLESRHPDLKLSQAAERIAGAFRKYILIRSVASLLTGLVTFCFALLVGLDRAPAWGVITFVLNYIPFLGPLAAVVLATLFAAAQFESVQMALIVLAGLSVIQSRSGATSSRCWRAQRSRSHHSSCCLPYSSGASCGAFPARSSACRSPLRCSPSASSTRPAAGFRCCSRIRPSLRVRAAHRFRNSNHMPRHSGSRPEGPRARNLVINGVGYLIPGSPLRGAPE